MPSTSERRSSVAQVVRELESLCDTLKPGDRIPTHTSLMQQYGASERAVRDALEDLQRRGRIIRRQGAGTFVAESGQGSQATATVVTPEQTIVAVARPDRSFFDRCMDLLFRLAEDEGLTLVCQPVDCVASPSVLAASLASRPLGFLVFSYTLAPLAERLQSDGWRSVVIGAPPVDSMPRVPCVYNDHEHGGYLVTRHLIDLGHRRIAFAAAGMAELANQRRWQGYQRALREARRAGKEVEDDVLAAEVTESWESDPAAARAYVRAPGAPTGIVAWNDHEAAKILRSLSRAGISVPDEVSLTGYDNLPEGKLTCPQLTTVDHNIAQQLRVAVNLLTASAAPHPGSCVMIIPQLLPGESTALPRPGSETGSPQAPGVFASS